MRRTVHLLGAVTLAMTALTVTVAAASGVARLVHTQSLPWIITLACLPAICVGYVTTRETQRVVTDGGFVVTETDIMNLHAVAVAAPVTRWLAVQAGLGPVVASALVGLLAGLFVPAYGAPVYCGSFVGMVGPGIFSDLQAVAGAGLVAGVVFVAAKHVFDGFGGKLGTTAFAGCGIVALMTGTGPAEPAALPTPATATGLVVAAGIAAAVAFVVSVRLDHGPVIGSAVVGLVIGLLAPALLPAGGQVAAVAFCASFVGMVSPDRLPTAGVTFIAGLLAGGLYVGTMPYLAGFGGKLGTIAFVACLATYGVWTVNND
ncbi:hypothetical protein SAMN05443574_10558 [Haloarcula vallismortis]|uniref:Uncharacterized protein n=2 Tax=Haloarcula vallismortis TaxID=28442 RepID=M0JF57_HALVA|nr:hypothetical protein [Haloarcula vallismortis]EMA06634.1 hypothetical protein C437_11028 [Haloarcula vallismortis ATCC 29715]SDW61746.1 hypothetical protein SAMN05443574_10558 [Haloarcula vallismortis]